MNKISDLSFLITNLAPVLAPKEYVFVSQSHESLGEASELEPIGLFHEFEGLSLIVPRERADSCELDYEGVFRMITLQVQSSLQAVGLTAVVAEALSRRGISANVVAAFYHDHLFIPSVRADEAMKTLVQLAAHGIAAK